MDYQQMKPDYDIIEIVSSSEASFNEDEEDEDYLIEHSITQIVRKSSKAKVQNEAVHGDCSICLEDFEGQELAVLPCGHGFSKDCINSWLENNDICPNCSSSVSKEKVINVSNVTLKSDANATKIISLKEELKHINEILDDAQMQIASLEAEVHNLKEKIIAFPLSAPPT